ncbi:Crp/Fnr family transcriptional regulator [Sandarakinorhabdus sp. DWP1-3-1]|uniref:Crp/Fnr family transcriptional regulator n=1 Tax=Sandarakinorhabdus sp. DWP1-3-1 TaxID=2804627 RepID=UPI003CFB33E9
MARSCSECGVRDRTLCASLDDDALGALGKLGSQRRLARGDTLIRAGDPPLVCANLQSGVMKIATLTPAGTESIVGLLYPGDFIGRPFAGASDHDIVALTDVELCVFPRAIFERVLAEHQRMEHLLLQRTLAELDRARRWLTRMGRATAGARVAGFLDDMGRRLATSDCRRSAGVAPGTAYDLPLSRGEIADLLGLTIETVSRQMTRLRAAGIIGLPGGRGIVVTDPAALAAAAEEFV